MPTVTYEIPYENAKEMLLVEEVDNKDFLTGLFDVMSENYQRQNLKRKNKQLLVYNFISIYTKQLVLGLTAF